VKLDAVGGHPTIAKEVAVSMEEQQQQLEAMILRNFLLVQADKHGHHLLASLPSIAGGDTPTGHQFPAHLTGLKVRQVPLKGLCHQLNIFFEAYTIKSLPYLLSVHALRLFKFLASLVQEKKLI
jgi:hypothetical protein